MSEMAELKATHAQEKAALEGALVTERVNHKTELDQRLLQAKAKANQEAQRAKRQRHKTGMAKRLTMFCWSKSSTGV